jgi:hypothetical protein
VTGRHVSASHCPAEPLRKPLNLDAGAVIKNTPPSDAKDPKSFEVKSGDAVFVRTTGGKDNWIWVPKSDTMSPSIYVNSGENKGDDKSEDRSVLSIRKLLVTNPPTFAPDGSEISLGDYVLIRDTAGADRRLRLDGVNNPVFGVKNDGEATAFRIADLKCSKNNSSASDFITVRTILDETNAPKNLGDIVKECSGNSTCEAISNVIAVWANIPPNSILGAAAAIFPQSQSTVQDCYFLISLPSGYRYCHSRIAVKNMTPVSGGSAPLLSIKTHHEGSPEINGLNIHMVLPKGGIGASGTWIEADLQIVGVNVNIAQAKYADGTCIPVPPGNTDVILTCKGNPCSPVNH